MQCEICGAKKDSLTPVRIEGVVMMVCEKCVNLGESINVPRSRPNFTRSAYSEKLVPERERLKEVSLKLDYGSLIKQKREELGIKQEALAKMISEKESLVHKMESSNMILNMDVARKIEKILKIKILEESNDSINSRKVDLSEGFTLGDLIKKKMK